MRTTEIIEALLFASDAPLTAADLSRADDDLDEDKVEQAILALRAEYDATGRAFQIYEVAGGYQLLTRPEYAGVLERFHTVPQSGRLSGPALEVLAIIAYRQPIGRAEIEEIRGIGSAGVLRTLQERQLIDVVGRGEGLGRPLLYGTTQKFLEHFGFNSLHDLPRPDELPVVLKQRGTAVAAGAPDQEAATATTQPAPEAQAPEASTTEPASSTAKPEAASAEPEAPTAEPEAQAAGLEAQALEPEARASEPTGDSAALPQPVPDAAEEEAPEVAAEPSGEAVPEAEASAAEPVAEALAVDSIEEATSAEPIGEAASAEPIEEASAEQPIEEAAAAQLTEEAASAEPIEEAATVEPVGEPSAAEPGEEALAATDLAPEAHEWEPSAAAEPAPEARESEPSATTAPAPEGQEPVASIAEPTTDSPPATEVDLATEPPAAQEVPEPTEGDAASEAAVTAPDHDSAASNGAGKVPSQVQAAAVEPGASGN